MKRIFMSTNKLYNMLRPWMMKETSYRCVTVSQLCDMVYDTASDSIKKDKELFLQVVNDLWEAAHDYTIESDSMCREDLTDFIEEHFQPAIKQNVMIENKSSHTPIAIEKVKKGDFIRLLNRENAPVYIRGEYSTLDWPRGKGRYECGAFDDISKARYLKKGTIVYIGFDF